MGYGNVISDLQPARRVQITHLVDAYDAPDLQVSCVFNTGTGIGSNFFPHPFRERGKQYVAFEIAELAAAVPACDARQSGEQAAQPDQEADQECLTAEQHPSYFFVPNTLAQYIPSATPGSFAIGLRRSIGTPSIHSSFVFFPEIY